MANMAALRAAVFSLSAKNRTYGGGVEINPPPVRGLRACRNEILMNIVKQLAFSNSPDIFYWSPKLRSSELKLTKSTYDRSAYQVTSDCGRRIQKLVPRYDESLH